MAPSSALEGATPPVDPRPAAGTRCVLLMPGAVGPPPAGRQAEPTGTPPATRPDVEDESADPVGDGHSDAEMARRLGQPRPGADPDAPAPTDEQKGRSAAP